MKYSKLTVVMPVFNEEHTIEIAVQRVLEVDLQIPFEIVVVDDGSTDLSIEKIEHLLQSDDVRLIRHDRNRGKGAAIRSGIENATGDLLTVLDADLEYDPHDYKRLLEPLQDGRAQVVYGTRSFGSQSAYSFWYVIGNRVVALWASFLFNAWLSDVETCFKLAPTEVWRAIDLRSRGFAIEAEMTGKLLRRRIRIFELPISYSARTRAAGKKLKWTDGVMALLVLLGCRLRRAPTR